VIASPVDLALVNARSLEMNARSAAIDESYAFPGNYTRWDMQVNRGVYVAVDRFPGGNTAGQFS
jgi:hypothetical protein